MTGEGERRRRANRGVRWAAVGALTAVLAATACSTDPAAPSPAPSVRVSTQAAPSSSTPSTTKTTWTQAQLDAEAERVFRAYYKEHVKALRAGGFETMPPEMKQYVGGPFEKGMTAIYQTYREKGIHFEGGSITISKIRPVHKRLRPGTIVGLEACTDATSTLVVDKTAGATRSGTRAHYRLYLKDASGRLLIWRGDSRAVKTCALD